MERSRCLIDYYLPPGEGFVVESLVATTYQVDFEFLEEELLAAALGVRSPVGRFRAFRSELERRLQKAEISVLYDLGGCDRIARLSPRIDAIPVVTRKLHSKISLLTWVREDRNGNAPPERRIRLIVGSANLTRQGFRENYECVVSLDYGGTKQSPRSLLVAAIEEIQEIAAESGTPQLLRQFAALTAHAARLPEGATGPDDPIALVKAADVVSTIRDTWKAIANGPPETVTVVSPFWTSGSTASEALSHLAQQLGSPSCFEMICCGKKSTDGKSWLPVFDGGLAVDLKKRLDGRLYLRAALPEIDQNQYVPNAGDEVEDAELAAKVFNEPEVQRSLHAKMIFVDGIAGSVLYAGSSNCTRRGLGLGGPSNFEAGFVYRLTSRQRKLTSALLSFAGPRTEVHFNVPPSTIQPVQEEQVFIPKFLSEVVATGSLVTIRFREPPPTDLVILMPIRERTGDSGFWLLYHSDSSKAPSSAVVSVDLTQCKTCDDQLNLLSHDSSGQHALPDVLVEVRWEGHTANYPVRFDDKTRLPFVLVGRKPSEGELIEYFLFGKEPDDWDGGSGSPGDEIRSATPDTPIDTRRILAYFIRRFVQAIPGIEAEIKRACYSRAALDAALRGPTSPLELAERAYESLGRQTTSDEPPKTATSVGFQLTEILASLLRCQLSVTDLELRECFQPVIERCRRLFETLEAKEPELGTKGFHLYRERILGDAK